MTAEAIDVLNPDGTPAHVVMDRAEAHRLGAWHRAVHLWVITPDRRVLLQRRAAAKENWPGRWDVSVAGHVRAGETAAGAAIREAREELGMMVSAEELRHVGTLAGQCVLNGGTYIDNEVHEVFVVRREVDPAALTPDPSEVAEVRLVTPEALDRYDLVPHPGEYALVRSIV